MPDLVHGQVVVVTPPAGPVVTVSNAPTGQGGGDGGAALAAHIASPAPHPAYDNDMPSLALIFENGII